MYDINKYTQNYVLGSSTGLLAAVVVVDLYKGRMKINPLSVYIIGAIAGLIILTPVYGYFLDKKTDK